jgi:hypothetical protein
MWQKIQSVRPCIEYPRLYRIHRFIFAVSFLWGYKGRSQERVAQMGTDRVGCKLDFGRKLLLSAAGLLAVAAPVVVFS